MKTTSILQDLFDYGDWANAKLFDLCQGLSDEQLDLRKEMGLGTLRNVLFHIVEAEKLWLERWMAKPWRAISFDADGLPLSQIVDEARQTAIARNNLISEEVETGFHRSVSFKDSDGIGHEWIIGDLLNHVANHGIHHRAQALNYLRGFDRTIPAGLDYLFWKIARPACPIPEESIKPLREYGIETNSQEGLMPEFDHERLVRYHQYNDWAMNRIFMSAETINENDLDREFEMGMGTLRKTLQHMIDAERWWIRIWTTGEGEFPRGEEPRSLPELKQLYADVSGQRNQYLNSLDKERASTPVEATGAGPTTRFHVIESVLQLCGHGTHHRCQALNMIRQSGGEIQELDLVYWLQDSVTK